MDLSDISDHIEIQQLLARYAVAATRFDLDGIVDTFDPSGSYSAFGATYEVKDIPTLVTAAPRGLFLVGPAAVSLDGDRGRGQQPLCFVDQTNHDMRLAYYTDTYRRSDVGWRLQTRSTTFLRRSGAHDAGRPHDPLRPEPSG